MSKVHCAFMFVSISFAFWKIVFLLLFRLNSIQPPHTSISKSLHWAAGVTRTTLSTGQKATNFHLNSCSLHLKLAWVQNEQKISNCNALCIRMNRTFESFLDYLCEITDFVASFINYCIHVFFCSLVQWIHCWPCLLGTYLCVWTWVCVYVFALVCQR